MKLRYSFFISIVLMSVFSMYAASTLVTGGGTAPRTSAEKITGLGIDTFNDSIFVSHDNVNGGAPGSRSIATAATAATALTGIGTDPLLDLKGVSHLAVAQNTLAAVSPYLAAVTTEFPNRLLTVSLDGSTVVQGVILKDSNVAPVDVVKITALEASGKSGQLQAFAFVKSTKTNGTDHGLAVVNVTSGTLAQATTDAVAGGAGNRAAIMDITTAAPFAIQTALLNLDVDNVQLFYDKLLDRLYVASNVVTSYNGPNIGGASGDGGRSIGVCEIAANGQVTARDLVPDAAFVNNQFTNIIGARTTSTTKHIEVNAHRIKTLHLSGLTTTATYLIVNGDLREQGNTLVNTSNRVYALPLVDKPASAAIHGTVADKGSALVANKFDVAATTNSHLVTNTETAALVGGGPLPIRSVLSNGVADMFIDAANNRVYVAVNERHSAFGQRGLYSSTATVVSGKITTWSTWAEVSTANDAVQFYNLQKAGITKPDAQGRIKLAVLNAAATTTWFVEGKDQRTLVKIT